MLIDVVIPDALGCMKVLHGRASLPPEDISAGAAWNCTKAGLTCAEALDTKLSGLNKAIDAVECATGPPGAAADLPPAVATRAAAGQTQAGSPRGHPASPPPRPSELERPPAVSSAPSCHAVENRVTDDGAPPLSASRASNITVRDTRSAFRLRLGSTHVLAGPDGAVPLLLDSGADRARLDF